MIQPGLAYKPGFEVDLLYKVDNSIYGSWISMAFDTKGRLVVSDQGKAGTFLIDIPEIGKTITTKNIKKLPLNSGQWGMLFAFDHLYMVSPSKVVRVPINKNGEFGEEEKLFDLYGGGEHGPHSLIVTEDGKGLYFIAGNFARTPSYENQEYQPTGKTMSYLRIMPTDTTETAKHPVVGY